jgi:hypothetical protein
MAYVNQLTSKTSLGSCAGQISQPLELGALGALRADYASRRVEKKDPVS